MLAFIGNSVDSLHDYCQRYHLTDVAHSIIFDLVLISTYSTILDTAGHSG